MPDPLTQLHAAIADRYRLDRELGHGGMATVYLAQDLKHHRQVALKILRPELAASLGINRFLREIEVAAGLQHPHILPLLDSGEAATFLYYVMPYVEGESLRERLARKGELPVSEAVRILAEVADALAYAHGRGVVHRDMKPENIMLSGRHPLIMDFGIAKAVNPSGASLQVTTQGVALGTPAYMAPEQAAADPHLDHRVDIYAIGVIGYELLTGSPPFTGTSAQQVLAAHMTLQPEPISNRRPGVPLELATIVMRCLEKRPSDRPQDADEILRTLESMVTPSVGLTPTSTRPIPMLEVAKAPRVLVIASAILALAVAGVVVWRGRATAVKSPVARHIQLTFIGSVKRQDISPDGELLAYVEGGDSNRLFVKDLTGGSILPIGVAASWTSTLRWSPNGASILYTGWGAKGKIRSMFPRLGGTPRPLPGHDSDKTAGTYAVLSPDGSRLATWYQSLEPPIIVTTLATGGQREISVPESLGWHDQGDWSPDGRRIALLSFSQAGDRWMLSTVDLETAAWHQVVSDTVPLSPPRWSAAGNALYYLRDENEFRKILVSTSGRPEGVPQILQSGLGASDFSITADQRKLSYNKGQSRSNLWVATKSGARSQFSTRQLTRGTTLKSGARLSPDGRYIAFVQYEQGKGDVFVVPRAGGAAKRVTSSGAVGLARNGVAWSPDSRHLAFITTTPGKRQVGTVSVDGGDERTFEKTNVSDDIIWAPHKRLLYLRPGNRNYHWLDPTTEAEEALVANDSVGWTLQIYPSPDKQYLAVEWNRKPRQAVYLISLKDGSQLPIGQPDVWPLGWSRDGTALYLEEESSHLIRRSPIRGGAGSIVGTVPFKEATCELTEEPPAIALLCSVDESVSDVWLMENFDPTVSRALR